MNNEPILDQLDHLDTAQAINLLLDRIEEPGKMSVLLRTAMPDLMGDADWARSIRRIYTRRVGAQELRSGATLVARGITKQIDAGLSAEIRHADPPARARVAEQLCGWAVYRFLEAAAALCVYGQVAGQLEALKAETGGKRPTTDQTRELSALRQEREKLRLSIQDKLWAAYLETCGGELEGER